MTGFLVHSVTAHVFRAPIAAPVVTSFGVMRDRPMALVRVEDADGAVGWGEIWCNFPSVGAEHRGRLIESVFAPLLEGARVEEPSRTFDDLTRATEVLALQSGELGPIAQCIAGIDIALWDLAARRAGVPLFRLLGGSDPTIKVYASGLNPSGAIALALKRRDEGHRAFKLKVGFGDARDAANLADLRAGLGPDVELMADANQAWDLAGALTAIPLIERHGLRWLEEPLRADRPWSEWRRLADNCVSPLAGGENIAGAAPFDAAIASGALRVLQPDVAKWGGISGCLGVARAALAGGLRYCPHWLGGGVGLLASAHLLAAVGGDGKLEIDANENPLRTLTCARLIAVENGCARLDDEPGLGRAPDLAELRRFRVA